MLKLLKKNIQLFCLHLGFNSRRRRRNSTPIIVVKKSRKSTSNQNPHDHDHYNENDDDHHQQQKSQYPKSATVYPNNNISTPTPIRIATFNAALFSMAPAVVVQPTPNDHKPTVSSKSINQQPKSILKQSPLHPSSTITTTNNNSDGSLTRQQKYAKSKLRVSINLPDNEISLGRSRRVVVGNDSHETNTTPKLATLWMSERNNTNNNSNRAVVDVLRELNADIIGLQDVKAEEGNEMKPLSDLAEALGMNYVLAESWAPEYGNAVLSKWPINKWSVHKIFDDSDFRNVLKTTIDVPQVGEVNFYSTHLDHLDENWRMKQINSIIESTNNEPHILAGGLNSLDEGDYSQERWIDIVKYYEEIGKPTPKAEVMRFLKHKQYTDAKDFGGECESVVMIAKGQSVQGTCKYGTRLDYILGSPSLEYKFVPGSYAVLSSKGTSDHHIVKVDILKEKNKSFRETNTNKKLEPKKRVVKITQSSSKGIWSTDMR